MPNVFAPYGFRQTACLTGHPSNFGISTDRIQASYTTPIYRGDPLVRLPNGYLAKAPIGATQIHGIFDGCRYSSAARNGATNYSQFWPGGNDALADGLAMVILTPDAVFQAQSGNSAAAAAVAGMPVIGLNIGIAYGAANTRLGFSAAYLDLSTLGTAPTLPFKVVNLVGDPPGVNGADITTAFGDLLVTFNNTDYRAPVAGI